MTRNRAYGMAGLCLVLAVFLTAGPRRMSAAVPVDVHHIVVPIKQEKMWHCWAASAAMINNWVRAKAALPALTALETAKLGGQEFVELYDEGDKKGIEPPQEDRLYKTLSFLTKRQQNLTLEAWADLLRKHGPLGVTISQQNKWAFHEVAVTTLKGDGTPSGTKITYVDPQDAKSHTLTFADFVKFYEQAAGYAIQIAYAA